MGDAAKKVEELQISYVTLESLEYVWGSAIVGIEKALTKGQSDWTTSTDVLQGILSGKYQLWAIHRGDDVEAVVVVSVDVNNGITKLFVRLIAGSGMDDWIDLLIDNLQRFKEEVGAVCIETSCRPGLAKYLQKIGWSKKAVIMELKDG